MTNAMLSKLKCISYFHPVPNLYTFFPSHDIQICLMIRRGKCLIYFRQFLLRKPDIQCTGICLHMRALPAPGDRDRMFPLQDECQQELEYRRLMFCGDPVQNRMLHKPSLQLPGLGQRAVCHQGHIVGIHPGLQRILDSPGTKMVQHLIHQTMVPVRS